jgi:cytosine/uracil/thiamine/allantoin permease
VAITHIGRFWATVIIAILGITATAFPTLINNAESFVLIMGNLAGPIGGVMLIDYLLFKRTFIDVRDLFRRGRYWYIAGLNPAAILSVFVGFVGFNFIPDLLIPTLSSLVLTGIVYYILVRIFSLFWEPMREGTMANFQIKDSNKQPVKLNEKQA